MARYLKYALSRGLESLLLPDYTNRMAESSPQPERSSLPRRDLFVGRQREMVTLQSALDDVLSGQGRMVMLVGEPGIGKTRTAQELAALAEEQGAQVFWGRCYEEQGAPPYWPWVLPMRAYVEQASKEQLAAEMGPGAADISEIIPEVRGKLPALETPRTLEPGQARFRLFDSITTFLKNAAQRQPLMLVLDDLHWADRSSLLLLEFLAQEIGNSPLLLIGAHRDVEVSRGHPLSQTLGALVREQLFHRVQLDGLTQQEVGELVEGNAGITLALETAEVIYSRTDGNPFFVGEVTRHVTLENITNREEWASIIPEGVRDAIGRRFSRLSEQCNQMLTTASIIGREFDFRLLIMLSGGVSEDQLLQAIDEAVSVQLIEDVPSQMDRYQFAHALIQQTLAEDVSPRRRIRLHARIAEALEALYGDDAESHAAELAHHFAEAQTSTGITKLVRYSLLAGEQALAGYAWDEAIAHYEKGLVAREIAMSGLEAACDEEAADLLFGLGRARAGGLQRSQIGSAVSALSRAFDYYIDKGQADQAIAVASYPLPPVASRAPGANRIISRGLALVRPDSLGEGRLLMLQGYYLGNITLDYDSAHEAFSRALTIARREGDESLEMRTLVAAGHVYAYHFHYQESLDHDLRAIDLARRVDLPEEEIHARWEVASVLHHMGDLEGARHQASAILAVVEQARHRIWTAMLGQAYLANGVVSILEGDWQSAKEFSDLGLEAEPRHDFLLANRAILEYSLGERDIGDEYLQRLLQVAKELPEGQGGWYASAAMAAGVAARITGTDDYLQTTEEAARAALSSPLAPALANYAQIGLTLLTVQRSDAVAAEKHMADLEARRGTMLGGALDSVVSADRLLGLLSQTMGKLDQAAASFEDALAFCRKAGYRPELAWTCCDYADMLLERGGEGDHPKAISLLNESLAISSELGMRPLMERVEARLAGLEPRAPITEYPGGLSQREVEVLRLVAAGKTDREIAEELYISFRTVGNHVRNILNKTNTINRTEAATYANQHGLLHSR